MKSIPLNIKMYFIHVLLLALPLWGVIANPYRTQNTELNEPSYETLNEIIATDGTPPEKRCLLSVEAAAADLSQQSFQENELATRGIAGCHKSGSDPSPNTNTAPLAQN